jgi:leucyl-tRNA synthetase
MVLPSEEQGGDRQPEAEELKRAINKAVQKVGRDLEGFSFNTAVSTLMELSNTMQRLRPALDGGDTWNWAVERVLLMLAPIAPHLADEVWHRRGHTESIHRESWPEYDEAMTVDEVVTIVVQVNGKVRDRLEAPRGEELESLQEQALASPRVAPHIEGKQVVKVVGIPDRLINIVVR